MDRNGQIWLNIDFQVQFPTSKIILPDIFYSKNIGLREES